MRKTTEERKLDNLLDLIIEAQIKETEHTPDNVLEFLRQGKTKKPMANRDMFVVPA